MRASLLLLTGFGLVACGSANAALIWNGPSMTFTRANNVDWTLPANQDRLTGNVWITRGNIQGIFNIRQEPSFTHDFSPIDTEWASGVAANWPSLTFTDWEGWTDTIGRPPAMVGLDAVMHLITDDIYVDVKFRSWQGAPGGGGFSYERSTPAVPEPSSLALLGIGVAFVLGGRRGCEPQRSQRSQRTAGESTADARR